MSSVRRADANIVNDDSLYGTSPPQTRFESVFTPEVGARVIKGPTQPRPLEVFYPENDHRSSKERQAAWLFGENKVQACIDKSDLIK
jgi:hypothetical protein